METNYSGYNLYCVKSNSTNCWDTYDSFVVCCKTENEAKMIHPSGIPLESNKHGWRDWPTLDQLYLIDVVHIGTVSEKFIRDISKTPPKIEYTSNMRDVIELTPS